jgi:hypothetical protein
MAGVAFGGANYFGENKMPPINLKDFGILTAKVEHLEKEVAELRGDVKHLVCMVEQAHGSWKTLMMVGGFSAVIGVSIAKILQWIIHLK